MKKKEFYITQKQIDDLKSEAKTTGMSMAEIVRRAIDHYFEKQIRGKNTNDNN